MRRGSEAYDFDVVDRSAGPKRPRKKIERRLEQAQTIEVPLDGGPSVKHEKRVVQLEGVPGSIEIQKGTVGVDPELEPANDIEVVDARRRSPAAEAAVQRRKDLERDIRLTEKKEKQMERRKKMIEGANDIRARMERGEFDQ